jgi:hypothetical protein
VEEEDTKESSFFFPISPFFGSIPIFWAGPVHAYLPSERQYVKRPVEKNWGKRPFDGPPVPSSDRKPQDVTPHEREVEYILTAARSRQKHDSEHDKKFSKTNSHGYQVRICHPLHLS